MREPACASGLCAFQDIGLRDRISPRAGRGGIGLTAYRVENAAE